MTHRRTCASRHHRGVKFNFRKRSEDWVYSNNIWEDMPLTDCAECHLHFSTDNEGYDHVISSSSHLKCELCTRLSNALDVELFESADALLTHWKQRHRLWCCEHCDVFFPDFQDRVDHILSKHAHFCSVCDTDAGAFATVELLQAHYTTVEHIDRSSKKESMLSKRSIVRFMGF